MIISESDIVVSLNGRDVGKYFFVLAVDENYVVLADGKGRKVEKPKRKKLKHVKLAARSEGRINEKIRNKEKLTNSDLRRALAQFCAGSGGEQGGM